jgi:hypothetical protein
VVVLDGDACEINGVGIAGVKGFGGGFGQRALGPWGEAIIKQFVHAAVDEAPAGGGPCPAEDRAPLALLHYAPVQQTAEGSRSRFFRPSDRAVSRSRSTAETVSFVSNVPVYNVSMPLLARTFPERPPFRVFEIPIVSKQTADALTTAQTSARYNLAPVLERQPSKD